MNQVLRRAASPLLTFALALALALLAALITLPLRAQEAAKATDSSQSVVYACPMHADVMADKPGKCPRCGMNLKAIPAPETSEYRVRLETAPRAVRAGSPVKLRFTLTHPRTGEQVKDFHILHDRPFHLFIVSQDLSLFEHLHPDLQKDGSLTIETTFPKDGPYRIYCDFFPVGGLPQVAFLNLITAGFADDILASQARLTPDQELKKTADGIRFNLRLDPARCFAGQPVTLIYNLADAATDQPITDLQPYLGAWGHTLILSEDGSDYLHSHPTEMIPAEMIPDRVDRSKLTSKPEVRFETFFPHPGNYRIWSQFMRGGRLTTVSFTIYVPRLN